MNKKILMICYYYPPLIDVGCKRSVAFSKYLKAHGWDPYIISVRNPDKNFCIMADDKPPTGVKTIYVWSLLNPSWLLGKINGAFSRVASIFNVKLKRNYFFDLFCIPDFFLGWIPGAVIGGYQAIKKNKIDYIYISCSPFSSAIAGIALKMLTKKPLIIDFRDPLFVNIPNVFHIPRFRKKIDCFLEKKIIKSSDLFIVNTEEVRKGYLDIYPDISHKIHTIYNGFDHNLVSFEPDEKFHKFTIVYGGNMYLRDSDSILFFKAVAWLKQQNIISGMNFQFLYFGQDCFHIQDIASELCISDLVIVRPLISHADMLKVIKKSHLQLLRIIKPMISTKLFEGIALNLPFLATIPEGEVADLIVEYSPSSYVVQEDDAQAIGEAIINAMNDFKFNKVKNNLVSAFLARFSREEMTRKLEQAIENIVLT